MTKRDIGTLAVRILAIFLFVAGTAMLPQVLSSTAFATPDIPRETWMAIWKGYVAGMLLYLGLGIALWFLADWLASKMLPGDDDPVVWPAVTKESLLMVGVVLIGVLTIAKGLPDLVHRLLINWPYSWAGSFTRGEIITAIVKVGVGIVLVALPLGIAAVRRCGKPAEEP